MNMGLRVTVALLAFFQMGASFGASAGGQTNQYSATQLMQLLKLRDAGTIDSDVLTSEVNRRGIGFKLDVATMSELSTNADVGWAGLKEIEVFLDTLPAAPASGAGTAEATTAKPTPVLDTKSAALLPALTTNMVVLSSNLISSGLNVAEVAGNVAQNGTSSSLLGTNTSAFGTNMMEIGQSYAALGTNLLLQANLPSTPYQAFISVGSEFMSPYGISVVNPTAHGTGMLTNAGNSTVGYVEFDYINHHVLRDFNRTVTTGKYFKGDFVAPWHEAPDIQFTMGFLFDNGTTITNGQTYTAQMLAGADYYSQLTLGFPIWRLDIANQSHQVAVEASGGLSTEQNFSEVHPNAFVGLAYETSFNPWVLSSSTNNCGFFAAKVGAGWIDVPSLVGTNNLVRLDGNEYPIFDLKPNWQLGAYLAYPLTSKLYLTVEANDYLGNNPPDSWNVKVGASVPLDSIANIFSSVISSVGSSK